MKQDGMFLFNIVYNCGKIDRWKIIIFVILMNERIYVQNFVCRILKKEKNYLMLILSVVEGKQGIINLL